MEKHKALLKLKVGPFQWSFQVFKFMNHEVLLCQKYVPVSLQILQNKYVRFVVIIPPATKLGGGILESPRPSVRL